MGEGFTRGGAGQGSGLTGHRSDIQCNDLMACAHQLSSCFPKTR